MILLDAFMDALSSLFPDLSRTLPTGGGPGIRASARGTEEEGSGQGGFAATLLQFLGGNTVPSGPPPAATVAPRIPGLEEAAAGVPFFLGGVGDEASQAGEGAGPEAASSPVPSEGQEAAPALETEPARSRPTPEEGVDSRVLSSVLGDSVEATPRGAGELEGHANAASSGGNTSSERTASAEAPGTYGTAGTGALSEGAPSRTDVPSSHASSFAPPPGSVPAPASAASMGAPDRDLDKLDPALRSRLERVAARMESEYGHKVEVVEGYRSSERQVALYQQGRGEPGPVVTWTRQSLHSQGRAVDVQVDGTWDSHEGYARLQQVAREEGLNTLGAKDPGHLELPDGDGLRWPDAGGTPVHRSGVGRSHLARAARVASPASVARVAQVARPGWSAPRSTESPRGGAEASVGAASAASRVPTTASTMPGDLPATPGIVDVPVLGTMAGGAKPVYPSGAGELGTVARGEAPSPTPSMRMGAGIHASGGLPTNPAPVQATRTGSEGASVPAAAAAPSQLGAVSTGQGGRRGGVREERREAAATKDAASEISASGASFSGASQVPVSSGSGVSSPSPLQPVGTVERVDRIQALEDALGAQLPGRIHLELDDVDGAGTRLRLALRGTQLDGSIGLSDPEAAVRMRARIGELHDALSRRGLEGGSLDLHSLSGTSTRLDADPLLSLRDPLAALARMAEPREGGSESRTDRGWTQQRDEAGRGPREHRDPERRDRRKEEGR